MTISLASVPPPAGRHSTGRDTRVARTLDAVHRLTRRALQPITRPRRRPAHRADR